jgi:hypothetical protein
MSSPLSAEKDDGRGKKENKEINKNEINYK